MSLEEKTNLTKLVKKIDIEGGELVYAIVKCYQVENDKQFSNTLPYDGKTVKTGMKWDLDKLPSKLLRMIEIFLKKHILKMSEEKVLRQTRKVTKKNVDGNTSIEN
jgi:hypothetical protein